MPRRRSMVSSIPTTSGPLSANVATNNPKRMRLAPRLDQTARLRTRWYDWNVGRRLSPTARSTVLTMRRPGARRAPTSKTWTCRHTGRENSGANGVRSAQCQGQEQHVTTSWLKWSSALAQKGLHIPCLAVGPWGRLGVGPGLEPAADRPKQVLGRLRRMTVQACLKHQVDPIACQYFDTTPGRRGHHVPGIFPTNFLAGFTGLPPQIRNFWPP